MDKTAKQIGSAGTLLGTGAQIAGAGLQFFGQRAVGEAAIGAAAALQRTREFEAKQLETEAGQARARGQREALEEKRQGRFVQSALLARAAASGAGAADPTVIGIAGDIGDEIEFRRLTALFQGEELARALESSAALRRKEGREAIRAGEIQQQTARRQGSISLLQSISGFSFFDRFGEATETEPEPVFAERIAGISPESISAPFRRTGPQA